MADQKFWRDVRVGVFSGAILTLLGIGGTWLLGWWPAIWGAAGGAVKGTGHVLAYSIPVPASALVVLVAGSVIIFRLWRRSAIESADLRLCLQTAQKREIAALANEAERLQREVAARLEAVIARPPAPVVARFQPSELQDGILQALAKLDGTPIYRPDLRAGLGCAQLLFDQAIDGLRAEDFISYTNVYGALGVVLGPKGRDFVIAAGYVGGAQPQ